MMNPEHISDSRTANQMALFSMKSMQHICLGGLTTAKGSTLFETLPTLVSLCERTNQNWPSENSSSTTDQVGLHPHFFRDCSLGITWHHSNKFWSKEQVAAPSDTGEATSHTNPRFNERTAISGDTLRQNSVQKPTDSLVSLQKMLA